MTTQKITAAEARSLAGVKISTALEDAYATITTAAKSGKREVGLYTNFWVNQGYSRSAQWEKACATLRNDGFNVSFFYEERQFVDMYTLVRW